MLFEDQECSEILKIKVKPGIVNKAKEVYKAEHPFCKRVDFDELFERIITLAAAKQGLITNADLGIPEKDFQSMQKELDISDEYVEPQIENNDTVGKESSALDLLN